MTSGLIACGAGGQWPRRYRIRIRTAIRKIANSAVGALPNSRHLVDDLLDRILFDVARMREDDQFTQQPQREYLQTEHHEQ